MVRTISSLENPIIKHLTKLRLNRDYRYEHQSVIISGIKPSTELLEDSQIKTVLAYDETFLPKKLSSKFKGNEIYLVNESIMKKVSGMQNPEGLLVEVSMPKQTSFNQMTHVLALDGINDPGNMGNLLRSALALGWQGAFVLENSCDPYNEKALRAARGATFRLPFRMGSWQELQNLINEKKWNPVVADLKGKNPEQIDKKQSTLLVLSNEAHGVSSEADKLCTKVTIPMEGKMESLNVSVAGGILLYLLKSDSTAL